MHIGPHGQVTAGPRVLASDASIDGFLDPPGTFGHVHVSMNEGGEAVALWKQLVSRKPVEWPRLNSRDVWAAHF